MSNHTINCLKGACFPSVHFFFTSVLFPCSSSRYPFPTVFSTCSKKDLAASLEKGVGMCLYNMPEVKVLYGGQKCGNGYVEEGEECDCGELEVKSGFKCLHSTTHLCNCEKVKQSMNTNRFLVDKQKFRKSIKVFGASSFKYS